MSTPPARPKIYHITHLNNLANICGSGRLICDRDMVQAGGPASSIGMSNIKRRRLEELEVSCHPSTKVGDYVPFYFCPRSVMLFVIHRSNNPELTFQEGQGRILHLEADLHNVVRWAEVNERQWAFSLSNAGARYVQFRSAITELDQLDWTAIAARDFRAPNIKEGKQAEFLTYEYFPFALVERIGVRSAGVKAAVDDVLVHSSHRLRTEIIPDWYY